MYNLVWQSVICQPGKLLILLVRKNQNAAPNRSDRQTTLSVPWGKRARHSHPDCRWPLILIVARQNAVFPVGEIGYVRRSEFRDASFGQHRHVARTVAPGDIEMVAVVREKIVGN